MCKARSSSCFTGELVDRLRACQCHFSQEISRKFSGKDVADSSTFGNVAQVSNIYCRVFLYKWTVNLKFLSEETFKSKELAALLLISHLGLLWSFAQKRWCRETGGILPLAQKFWRASQEVGHILAIG